MFACLLLVAAVVVICYFLAADSFLPFVLCFEDFFMSFFFGGFL